MRFGGLLKCTKKSMEGTTLRGAGAKKRLLQGVLNFKLGKLATKISSSVVLALERTRDQYESRTCTLTSKHGNILKRPQNPWLRAKKRNSQNHMRFGWFLKRTS